MYSFCGEEIQHTDLHLESRLSLLKLNQTKLNLIARAHKQQQQLNKQTKQPLEMRRSHKGVCHFTYFPLD